MKVVLPRSVLALSQLASTGNLRFATDNVLLTASGGNHRCEATNGKILGIINGIAEGDASLLINARKLAEIKKVLDKNDEKIIIEAENGSFKAIGGNTHGAAMPTRSAIAGEYDTVRVGDSTEGQRWPNTNSVLPKTSPVASCKVDPLLLIDLFKAAAAVDGRKQPIITIHFYADGQPLSVSTSNEESTQFFDGMFCPLSSK